MANIRANNGATQDLQEKEVLYQLNNRESTYTENIKSELRYSREGAKILDQDIFNMADLQREVDVIRMYMVKTYQL